MKEECPIYNYPKVACSHHHSSTGCNCANIYQTMYLENELIWFSCAHFPQGLQIKENANDISD